MQLARAWQRDFGVEVLVAAEPGLLPALRPLADGARLVPVRLSGGPAGGGPAGGGPAGGGAAARARQAAALRPALLRHRPDAVLVELPLPTEGLGALAACAALGVPALGHAHLVRRDWVLGHAERAEVARLVGHVGWSAVSAPAARRLEGLFGLPLHAAAAVPNGLADTRPTMVDRAARRAALGVETGARLALMLGSLDERKGAVFAPDLARAAAPHVLALAGDGPLRAAIANDAPPNLRLLGPVPDPRAWLACADAFVLPSLHEGCPLALLEAAAERVPILASRDALEAWDDPARMAVVVRRNPSEIAGLLGRPADPARVAAAAAAVTGWDERHMAARLAWLLAREAARLRPARAPGLVGRGAALEFGMRRAALVELAGGEAAWSGAAPPPGTSMAGTPMAGTPMAGTSMAGASMAGASMAGAPMPGASMAGASMECLRGPAPFAACDTRFGTRWRAGSAAEAIIPSR